MSEAAAPAEPFWRSRRSVGLWLLGIAAIILGMITVGGLTRITGSGLSITQWDVIMGALPPLNDAQWLEAFASYRHIPQYAAVNAGMSLEAFKGIFWWEWAHRLLGRLLGFVFLIPFLWFAWVGAIRRAEWPRMVLLFVLGGLQGFVGWWMVQSGLETRVSVSQYRLAVHLGFALILLVAMVWAALEYLRRPPPEKSLRDFSTSPKGGGERLAIAFAAMVYVQMLLGALVAGLHAGLVYNTWPLMDGRLLPEEPFFSSPWWINFFENPGLAQFDHRIGAYVIAVVAVFIGNAARGTTGWARFSGMRVLNLTAIQLILGIATLLFQAPEFLAAAHQLVAALLLCAVVWHIFELRPYTDYVLNA